MREPATTSQTTIYCKRLQTKGLSSTFVYWFMRGLKPYLFFFTQTAIPQLTVEEVSSNPLLLPSLPEQTAIAAFLDRETAKIDALVQEQQRLIELLKEKRQAVISHAVIKGLNPDAPMKDGGVEWLGGVPEHWTIKRLGRICEKIGSGKTPKGGAEVYELDGVLFLRSQNVYDEGLALDEVVYIGHATDEEMSASRVVPGDVLLTRLIRPADTHF